MGSPLTKFTELVTPPYSSEDLLGQVIFEYALIPLLIWCELASFHRLA